MPKEMRTTAKERNDRVRRQQGASISTKCRVVIGVLFAGFSLSPVDVAAQKAKPIFQAGAATSDITPFLGTDLIGGFAPRGAAYIHDPLLARCLVLDDGKTRIAIVIIDNVKFPTEIHGPTKRRIEETTGLPPENVLIAGTHTHSAPSLRGKSYLELDEPLDEYQQFVIRRITDGVRQAVAHLEPARIGWGSSDVPRHVFNRRWLLKDGETVTSPYGEQERAAMNPGRYLDRLDKPAGPVNPRVYFLSVDSLDGRPIALLANYWLHYVGGTGSGHVSADYFGVFGRRIGELMASPEQDPPFVGILSNGASGDINNNDYANYGKPGRKRYERYEKMREVADDLAREVVRARETIEYHDWVPLGATAEVVTLRRRRPTPAEVRRAEETLEVSDPGLVESLDFRKRAIFARRAIEAADWPETAEIFVQALRIGELGMAALPFEVFCEIGLEIEERSPFPDTFVMALANGGFGYLPFPRQHELGGYETWLTVAHTEEESSPKLVAKLMELFADLRE